MFSYIGRNLKNVAEHQREHILSLVAPGCTAQCDQKSINFTSVFGKSSGMDIVGFLEGKTPDHRGQTLSLVLAFSNERAEQTHDYLKWLFPLNKPSGSVQGTPVLSGLDIDEIKEKPMY